MRGLARKFGRLLEVFSAQVWCDYHPECKVTGRIMVKEGDKTYSVFSSQVDNAQDIRAYCPLKLTGPSHGIDCSDYFRYWSSEGLDGPLKLELAIRCLTHQVVLYERHAILCYSSVRTGYEDGERRCIVGRSKDEHGAVFFSLFQQASQAMLEVKLTPKGEAMKRCFKTRGRVTAEYSQYQYRTQYEQECFRVAVFDERSTEGVLLLPQDNAGGSGSGSASGFCLPLSGNVVAVPKDSTLVLGTSFEFLAVDPAETTTYLTSETGNSEKNCKVS